MKSKEIQEIKEEINTNRIIILFSLSLIMIVLSTTKFLTFTWGILMIIYGFCWLWRIFK